MKKLDLKKALDQESPEKSFDTMTGKGFIYYEICKKLYHFLDGLSPGDSGEYECEVYGHNFYIDYKIKENDVELCCPSIYLDGEETRYPWLDWSFDEAKPDFGIDVEKWPDILNYSEFM
jgi:hypothetical protein